MPALPQITLTEQEFDALLCAFFSVAPDHVGNETFHADVMRVGGALLEAMRERPNSSIGMLEARAEELLQEPEDEEAQDREHMLTAHEYGLRRAA
jgi:hypothetical protein